MISEQFRLISLRAASEALNGSVGFFYRKTCRMFSKQYFTPLMAVYELPFSFVLQQIIESDLDDLDEEDLYETARKILVPTGSQEDEELIQKQIAKFEAEEKIRKKKGHVIGKKKQKKKRIVRNNDGPKEVNFSFPDEGDPDAKK